MHQHELISIVIATYNRSNVLRYAIETVLFQSYKNWELIIVGDCCTDDTEEVVGSFKNDRIRFINLEKNIGEQSGPNNHGVSIANGSFIAFLNHDDLWFPNHLELLYQKLHSSRYDLVYSNHYIVPVDGKLSLLRISENNKKKSYYSPASTWLFNKELYNEVGPFKYYKKIYNVPSQEWLLRVSKTKKIGVINEVTVIAIQSGARINSYKNRDFEENKFYYGEIKKNPDKILKDIYFNQYVYLKEKDGENTYHIKAVFRNFLTRIFPFFGLSFEQAVLFIKNPKKGSFINSLRKKRGLPTIK